jgi:RNA polymerase-binding transcription factor DksA
MSIFDWRFGSQSEEDDNQLEQEVEAEQETAYETPEQRHQRENAGYCPGCGYPIDDHPRNVGLSCDEWYK